MELTSFAGMDSQTQTATVATMDAAALGQLAMAAERAADSARFTTRDGVTTGLMTNIALMVRGEQRRRCRPVTRTTRRTTGCVAKCNGRWVAW